MQIEYQWIWSKQYIYICTKNNCNDAFKGFPVESTQSSLPFKNERGKYHIWSLSVRIRSLGIKTMVSLQYIYTKLHIDIDEIYLNPCVEFLWHSPPKCIHKRNRYKILLTRHCLLSRWASDQSHHDPCLIDNPARFPYCLGWRQYITAIQTLVHIVDSGPLLVTKRESSNSKKYFPYYLRWVAFSDFWYLGQSHITIFRNQQIAITKFKISWKKVVLVGFICTNRQSRYNRGSFAAKESMRTIRK